jgi:phosphoesterase RecJ-like protein
MDACWTPELHPRYCPDPGVVAALRQGEAFAVIPHILPDVDALSSAEGLCRILRAAGRRAWVFAPEVPAIYRWALAPELCGEGEPEGDLVRIGIDTSRPERLQIPGPVALNIDHHEDNPGFGTVGSWVAPAPSCTCLLPALAEALGVPIEGRLATALYVGLVGDTEGFRTNLSPEAFAWAAWLAARGADCAGVADRFWERSPGFWAYLAEAQGRAVLWRAEGRPPLLAVPVGAELPQHFALRPYENALLPSHLSPPAGGILVILQEGKSGVRFRLRSREVDVLPLAHALGGGGHPQAAGVVLRGAGLAEAEAALRRAWEGLPQAQAPGPGTLP